MRDEYDFKDGVRGKYGIRNGPPLKQFTDGEALFFLNPDGSREVAGAEPITLTEAVQQARGEIAPPSQPVRFREPSWEELQRIAAGDLSGVDKTGVEFYPGVKEDGDEIHTDLCPYKELDEQTGEWVHCGLPVHGPKVKHTAGRRESA